MLEHGARCARAADASLYQQCGAKLVETSSAEDRTVQYAPYSYRDDAAVPAFDDARPLVIFDGLCVLCASGVHWMLARDPKGVSQFAVIQSSLPQALYRHYALDAEAFDTFMVLANGKPHVKWAGVIAAGQTLPWPWRGLASVARVVPRLIGDKIYDVVQRNRIAWFGRRDVCVKPSPQTEKRLIA